MPVLPCLPALHRAAGRLLALLALTGACAAAEPALPAGLSLGPALGGVQAYQLDNGLQLLLMPVADHPVTRVTVTYRVGSRHEGPGEAGMAHLLEHMTFRGTRQLSDLAGELNRLAVTYNGSTSSERTNYFGAFKPGPALLRQVLQLEAARMGECRLDAADFAKEKPIVLNEMGLRAGSTGAQLAGGLQAASFRLHPYGRPVIGHTADIEQLSLPTLRAFYERHYRPDNAVVMIAGAFDSEQALAAVAETFGRLRRDGEAPPAVPERQPEAEQQGLRTLTLRTPQSGLAVAFRVPGMAHADAPAVAVMAGVLWAASNAWLAETDKRGQISGINGQVLTREPFLFGLVLTLPGIPSRDAAGREKLQALEDSWLDRLDRSMVRHPVFAAYVERTAQSMSSALEQRLRDPASAAAVLSDAIGAGDWRLAFRHVSALRQVSADDVLRVEGRYVRRLNRAVAHGVTDASVGQPEFVEADPGLLGRLFARKADVPAIANPASDLDAVQATAVKTGEAFDADPAAIELRVRRYRLPSGLLLAVLPKDSADDRVVAHLEFRWGSTKEMMGQPGWRGLSTVAQHATTQRSVQEVQAIQRALQDGIRVVSGPQSVQVQIVTRGKLLAQALTYTREFLSQPALLAADFETERNAALAPGANAGSPAVLAVRRHINQQRGDTPLDIGYQPLPADVAASWRGLDLEQVRRFHRDFWSANEARIAIVGHVPDTTVRTVERLFGSWKKPDAPRHAFAPDRHLSVGAARHVHAQADAQAATVTLVQEIPLAQDAVAYPPALVGLRLLAAATGSGGGRLVERLRQQDAISYNVVAQLHTPARGDRSVVSVTATGAPHSALRVEATLREEIARVLRDGVSAQEVEVAQQQLLELRRQQRGDDRQLAVALVAHFDGEGGFDSNEGELDAALQAVTPGQVLAALRLLLHPDRWMTAITGARPEAASGR